MRGCAAAASGGNSTSTRMGNLIQGDYSEALAGQSPECE